VHHRPSSHRQAPITLDDDSHREAAGSEQRYRLLSEMASDVVYQTDTDGAVEWISPSVTELLGWPVGAVVGQRAVDFVHPADRERVDRARARVRHDETTRETLECRVRTAAGGHRWMAVRVRPLVDRSLEVIGSLVALRDIDDRVQVRQALEASEERFRMLAENASDVVYRTNLDGVCEWMSPSAEWVLGIAPEELVGRSMAERVHPDDLDALTAQRRRSLQDAVPTGLRVRFRRADGSYVWVLARARPTVVDGAVDGLVVHVTDVDEEVRALESLAHAVVHDPLTGLTNRPGLIDEVTRALAAQRRDGHAVGVFMVDLDFFKHVNDALGHAVGDALLREAAGRLRATLRVEDLVARPGGDEFVVVLRSLVDPRDAVRAANRIVRAFRVAFEFDDNTLYATASVGIVIAQPGTHTPDELLRDADTAMYRAKAEGRDRCFVYNDELREVVDHRLRVESELRGALDRDELEVHYQPEIDLETGAVLAVEALLRWHHPSGAMLPAADFIDVAEETGLILDVGDWVMRQAFGQAGRWARSRPDHPVLVRVNMSALQLSEAGLLGQLDAALGTAGIRGDDVSIEITETALLRQSAAVSRNLNGMRERGIKIALDDFGVGYASLAYLRDYPVDAIKLDRSFVAGIVADEHHARIVSGIVALAERLGIAVTAEGVEDPRQAVLLRELGCRTAQGFLYSPAVPAAQIDRLLGTG